MGGLVENVDLLPIGGNDVTLETVQGWFSDFRGQDAQVCPSSSGVSSKLEPDGGRAPRTDRGGVHEHHAAICRLICQQQVTAKVTRGRIL